MFRPRYEFYVGEILNQFKVQSLAELSDEHFIRLLDHFYDEQTTGVTFLKAAIDDHFETLRVINLLKCYRRAEQAKDINLLKLSDDELEKLYELPRKDKGEKLEPWP